MKNVFRSPLLLCLLWSAPMVISAEEDNSDARQWVQFPEMMQRHMLANMRDHLLAIDEIVSSLGSDDLDKAADIAEYRLGMSAMESHGARHQARFMPDGMRQAGTAMHGAASRFARTAEEGDLAAAVGALAEVTAACVACHAAYRVR